MMGRRKPYGSYHRARTISNSTGIPLWESTHVGVTDFDRDLAWHWYAMPIAARKNADEPLDIDFTAAVATAPR